MSFFLVNTLFGKSGVYQINDDNFFMESTPSQTGDNHIVLLPFTS